MIEERPIEPPSWLRLERYHLGELSAEEAREVERVLAVDAATRACLDEIRRPMQLRPLPDVPSRPAGRLGKVLRARWPLLSLAAVASAGIALFIGTRSTSTGLGVPAPSAGVKGGYVALALIREHDGGIDSAPTNFGEGDRFKVLLSCPPAFDGRFDVVVLQDGVPSFPFSAPNPVVCGNRVPLPGAFVLSGASPATVCVTWARDPDSRRAIERGGIGSVQKYAACVVLEPRR